MDPADAAEVEANRAEVEVNRPEVLAEVQALFERYERALVDNDVEALDSLFWPDARVLRFGGGENLYGIEAIRAFRHARTPPGVRELRNAVITTFGSDFATTNTEFYRADPTRCGRQSQTWVRFESGWRIVAAHVSIVEVQLGALA